MMAWYSRARSVLRSAMSCSRADFLSVGDICVISKCARTFCKRAADRKPSGSFRIRQRAIIGAMRVLLKLIFFLAILAVIVGGGAWLWAGRMAGPTLDLKQPEKFVG